MGLNRQSRVSAEGGRAKPFDSFGLCVHDALFFSLEIQSSDDRGSEDGGRGFTRNPRVLRA